MKHLLLAIGLAAGLQAQTPPVLHVDDVVESVRKRYPALLVALADRDIADADVLAAEGRFDTVVRSRFDSDSLGYYTNRRFDTWVEQPFNWQGLSVNAGYRVGDGDFAPYDGKLATRSLGELRSGIRFPLLRDRSIDSRRGDLAKARIGRKLADLSVDQQRLAVLQSAISRYWLWVANGRRLQVARDVLQVAEARQKLLEEGVREGQIPRIDAVDNERAILQRRSSVVEADRAFQQTCIELSLFLRDASGSPVVPVIEQVPSRFPSAQLPLPDLESDIRNALGRRPEIARLEAQADQNDIDLRVAQNSAKPAIDLTSGFASESGSGNVSRGPQEFRAGLSFEFSLQNRAAKGRQGAAEARARQFNTRISFLKDQVTAEVQDALVGLRAARERLQFITDEVRVSRELEDAERARFELGEGTLFMLNLREQATMDAAVREALAQADFQRARAAYDYATGALLNAPVP